MFDIFWPIKSGRHHTAWSGRLAGAELQGDKGRQLPLREKALPQTNF